MTCSWKPCIFSHGRMNCRGGGKSGCDVLMKGTLKNVEMKDVSGLFYAKTLSRGFP